MLVLAGWGGVDSRDGAGFCLAWDNLAGSSGAEAFVAKAVAAVGVGSLSFGSVGVRRGVYWKKWWGSHEWDCLGHCGVIRS